MRIVIGISTFLFFSAGNTVAQNYFHSDIYLQDSIAITQDFRQNILLVPLLSNSEKEIILEICNEQLNYLEAQLLLVKRIATRGNNEIHITFPIVECLYSEVQEIKQHISCNDIKDLLNDIIEKADLIIELYIDLIILTKKYPYESEHRWYNQHIP